MQEKRKKSPRIEDANRKQVTWIDITIIIPTITLNIIQQSSTRTRQISDCICKEQDSTIYCFLYWQVRHKRYMMAVFLCDKGVFTSCTSNRALSLVVKEAEMKTTMGYHNGTHWP